ncbi:unnamed protein product [Pleuronectes platessa]|uniref:Uncharacterized protein n=1 Tax=Pleuronectes platessa TaxID=8262 RepID=A0A9N7Z2D0_PLEPL|nr:unnamed protein product [Pleuronectes platessa]
MCGFHSNWRSTDTGADWCRLVQTGADWCRLGRGFRDGSEIISVNASAVKSESSRKTRAGRGSARDTKRDHVPQRSGSTAGICCERIQETQSHRPQCRVHDHQPDHMCGAPELFINLAPGLKSLFKPASTFPVCQRHLAPRYPRPPPPHHPGAHVQHNPFQKRRGNPSAADEEEGGLCVRTAAPTQQEADLLRC